MTSTYTISPTAYYKLFFHAAKHPQQLVNGVFLGKQTQPGGHVEIEDAIPLLHHWTSLSPMMEIGLDLADQFATEAGLKLVAYYQARPVVEDVGLGPVGEKITQRLKSKFPDAVAFVLDGNDFGSEKAGLIPYINATGQWRPVTSTPNPFSPGSNFQLSSPDLPSKAVLLVRDEHSHHAFGDFDDHLEDVTIDWLRNRASLPLEM